MARTKRFRDADPLCSHCKAAGRIRVFTVLDHVVALVNGGADTGANLQRLCDECHRDKTARDMRYKVVERTGRDGWPESLPR